MYKLLMSNFQYITHQKSLKSVSFCKSYSKNKKVGVFATQCTLTSVQYIQMYRYIQICILENSCFSIPFKWSKQITESDVRMAVSNKCPGNNI